MNAQDFQPYRKGFTNEPDDLERKYGGARGGKSKNPSLSSTSIVAKNTSTSSDMNQKSVQPFFWLFKTFGHVKRNFCF